MIERLKKEVSMECIYKNEKECIHYEEPMTLKESLKWAILILIAVYVIAFISYGIGYKIAKDKYTKICIQQNIQKLK